MIQRDTRAAMSASASGSIGVWQGGASASGNFKNAAQRSREQLNVVSTRAAERTPQIFKLTTRDPTDNTSTNLTERIIRNGQLQPVSYGLRRVVRQRRAGRGTSNTLHKTVRRG